MTTQTVQLTSGHYTHPVTLPADVETSISAYPLGWAVICLTRVTPEGRQHLGVFTRYLGSNRDGTRNWIADVPNPKASWANALPWRMDLGTFVTMQAAVDAILAHQEGRQATQPA